MSRHLSQITKDKISKTRIRQNEKKKRLRKKIQHYEKMIIAYYDLVSRLRDELEPAKIGNDKIYIPYHPERNREEREKLMGKLINQGWKYVDARRIWDAPFSRWLYFWILKR